MPAQIELEFGDGEYLFALNVPQILELQRLCAGEGIFTIYGRLVKGWYSTPEGLEFGLPHEAQAGLVDIFETIRLALIGGGRGMVNGEEIEVSALRAKQLVETYCHPPVPLKQSWEIARAVIFATIEGYEPQKKSPALAGEEPKASTKRRSSRTAR